MALYGVQGGCGLAEDDVIGRPQRLAYRLEAGGRARMLHHFPAGHGIGITERGPTVHAVDLGIVTATPRSYSVGGRCRPRTATALMLLPHTGNFVGCLPGTTSADRDLSQLVIMDA